MSIDYWGIVKTAILGSLELPTTVLYTPGVIKLSSFRRAKDGTGIAQAVVNSSGKVILKRTISLQGLDEGLYYEILAELEKAEFLYFRSPLNEIFDGGTDEVVGDQVIKHFNKVYFQGHTTSFNASLNTIEYTITLVEK